MQTKQLDAWQLFGTRRWQALQDSLARVTRLAIIAVDYRGVPVSRHSAPHPFCRMLRADARLAGYCQKCDARGALEAVRTGAPYIYLCHCGIVDVAVPVMVEGQYIGALMAGQVRFPREEETGLEQVMAPPGEYMAQKPKLSALYTSIPILSIREIRTTADMLFHLCACVARKADEAGEAEEPDTRQMDRGGAEGFPAPEGERGGNATLRPALNYIHQNRSVAVTQKQMADLCHVSTSYFSRLFSREVGEGFTSFLARQRVEWSKQLLEETALSVNQISDRLGFSSCGYFIKTFKRYESVTPAVYRKQHTMGETAPRIIRP